MQKSLAYPEETTPLGVLLPLAAMMGSPFAEAESRPPVFFFFFFFWGGGGGGGWG